MEELVKKLIDLSLEEDIKSSDITTDAIVNPLEMGEAIFIAKEEGVLAGIRFLTEFYEYLNKNLIFTPFKEDGQLLEKNESFAKVTGFVKDILTYERIALNFIQRMSGIATATHKFVEQIKDTKAKIIDTRKTAPGLRMIDKEAVRIGGGENHRFGLHDMFLIKDNHIVAAGSITNAVNLVLKYKEKHNLNFKIEVETKKISEIKEAINCDIDRIMFDNFSIDELFEGVEIVNGKFETEASGGVSLENVRDIALTGVDYISIGSITHSFKAIDISLEL